MTASWALEQEATKVSQQVGLFGSVDDTLVHQPAQDTAPPLAGILEIHPDSWLLDVVLHPGQGQDHKPERAGRAAVLGVVFQAGLAFQELKVFVRRVIDVEFDEQYPGLGRGYFKYRVAAKVSIGKLIAVFFRDRLLGLALCVFLGIAQFGKVAGKGFDFLLFGSLFEAQVRGGLFCSLAPQVFLGKPGS